MAFFDPGTQPTEAVDPSTYDRVRSEWDSFLGNPQGRAALLSAGLALMQPPSFGDTPVAQIGRAIGSAGESASRNEAMDLKKSEAESKDAAREAQASARLTTADAATSRAEAAQARAGAAGDRLGYQAQRLQDMQARANLQGRLRASIGYQNYLKQDSTQRLLNPSLPPPMDRDTWMKANGLTDIITAPQSGNTGTSAGDEEAEVPLAATTTSGAPPMPKDKALLQVNQRYTLPNGEVRTWNGTVFR